MNKLDNVPVSKVCGVCDLVTYEHVLVLQECETVLRVFTLYTCYEVPRLTCMQHDDLVIWNCTRCKGPLDGFRIHRSIFLYDWDLTAFVGYWPLFDAVFAVFRGTDSKSISNWVSNLDAHRHLYQIPGVPPEQLPPTRGASGLQVSFSHV